jgi:hypothetical protein
MHTLEYSDMRIRPALLLFSAETRIFFNLILSKYTNHLYLTQTELAFTNNYCITMRYKALLNIPFLLFLKYTFLKIIPASASFIISYARAFAARDYKIKSVNNTKACQVKFNDLKNLKKNLNFIIQ